MITYSLAISKHSSLKYTALCYSIGENILFQIYKNRLKTSLKDNFITYTEWKKDLKIKDEIIIKLGDFFLSILSNYPSQLFDREYIKESYKIEYYTLKINEKYLNLIRDNIIIPPFSLPMISKPIEWSCKSYGGFLENKIIGEDIITGSKMHEHKMENKKPLYNAINYLNSIKFCINELLFEYLNNEGSFLLNDIKAEDELQRIITLKISETYLSKPFYLNVHADWRGRIYTHSFFINYQGSDLTSALLNIWDGEPLTDEGKFYFYIYGANNHNDNNISKESFKKRIQWIQDNYNKIINLNKELILSAENPFIFTSFCLIMKELTKNPNTVVKIPVFLDASCNGIQHLAALMQDFEIGSKVNLVPYELDDKPKDIYSELVDPINKAINEFGIRNGEYNNLALVKLNRKIIKQSIMTKVYNVTTYGISQQIQNNLEKINCKNSKLTENITKDLTSNLKKINETFFIAPGIYPNFKVNLTYQDIYQIANIINDQIFVIFPSLNKIYDYLLNITELIIELGIPLTWITPAGIKITQHYLKSKKKTIAIKFLGKLKRLVIRQWTDIINKGKQKDAIIPNIIHSLDATHLINIINKAKDQNFYPILPVHDCFGTHPNKMGTLEYNVKKEFILLYTDHKFLVTFHKRIIQSIKDNNFTIIKDKKKNYVICNNNYLEIPSIPKLGKLDLGKIIESKYMIN